MLFMQIDGTSITIEAAISLLERIAALASMQGQHGQPQLLHVVDTMSRLKCSDPVGEQQLMGLLLALRMRQQTLQQFVGELEQTALACGIAIPESSESSPCPHGQGPEQRGNTR